MKENIVYKGSERRVIVVKNSTGKHFEEAHFYLKAGEGEGATMPDLLREANRIVEHSLLNISPRAKQRAQRRRWFMRGMGWGFFASALLAAGIWLVGCLIGWF